MSDSQMKHIGQIQPAKKPTKDKINSAYQHSSPRSQMSWGGVHTSQHVAKNNQIACNVVYFHCGSRGVIQTEIGAPFKQQVIRQSGALLEAGFEPLRAAFSPEKSPITKTSMQEIERTKREEWVEKVNRAPAVSTRDHN